MIRSKSYYEYVTSSKDDEQALDAIKFDGQIMPLRATGQDVIRGEDIVWLMEAVKQRTVLAIYKLPLAAVYRYNAYTHSWEKAELTITPAHFIREILAYGDYYNLSGIGMKDSLDKICDRSVYEMTEPVVGEYIIKNPEEDSSEPILVAYYDLKTIPDLKRYHANVADIASDEPLYKDKLLAYFNTIHLCNRMFGERIPFRDSYKGYASATELVPENGGCDLKSNVSGAKNALSYYFEVAGLSGIRALEARSVYWRTSEDSDTRECAAIYSGLADDTIIAKFEAKFVKRAYGVVKAHVYGSSIRTDGGSDGINKYVVIPLGEAAKDGDVFTFTAKDILGPENVKAIVSACGYNEVPAQERERDEIGYARINIDSAFEVVLDFDDHTAY